MFIRKLNKLIKSPRQFVRDSSGKEIAKQKVNDSSRLLLSFHYSIWLVLPIICLFSYLFFIATPQFESTAVLVTKNADDKASVSGAPMALLGVDTGQNKDAYMIQHYILSQDMLQYLEKHLALREHFSDTRADWLSALSTNATREDFYQYYLNKVSVEFDDIAGLITLSVKSFSAEFSQKMIALMIKESERFINELSHKMAKSEVAFVEGELGRAHQTLVNLTGELTQFQNDKKIYSTEQQGTAVLASLAELNSLLITKQTELETLLSYMNERSPEIITLKHQVAALNSQISKQQNKLVNNDKESLNELDIEYRNLTMQIEFATDVYKAALIGLEQTRVEAHRKLKHLLVVVQPNLADEALYPRRLYWFVTLSILLALMYSIVVMLIATVKEHKED